MADEVEVTVTESDKETETETPAPVVVTTPVIINESNDDASGDGDTDLAVLIGNLAARVEALENRETVQDEAIESATVGAEIATNIATDALMSDESGEEEETDKSPAKPHWVHRPLSSIFGDSD